MFQVIDGKEVYVVELTDRPWSIHSGGDPKLAPYAMALNFALQDGIVTGPGKYAIHVDLELEDPTWNVFRVIE